jgi:hypothetical protein
MFDFTAARIHGVEILDVVAAERSARDEQQIRPLVGPVVHEVVALEQRVHEPRALVGPGVRDKRVHVGARGQRAGRVQERAADELVVAAERAMAGCAAPGAWPAPARRSR